MMKTEGTPFTWTMETRSRPVRDAKLIPDGSSFRARQKKRNRFGPWNVGRTWELVCYDEHPARNKPLGPKFLDREVFGAVRGFREEEQVFPHAQFYVEKQPG